MTHTTKLLLIIVHNASAIGIETLKVANMLKNKKLAKALSDRTYHCPKCDITIDRDVNAAINLKPTAVG